MRGGEGALRGQLEKGRRASAGCGGIGQGVAAGAAFGQGMAPPTYRGLVAADDQVGRGGGTRARAGAPQGERRPAAVAGGVEPKIRPGTADFCGGPLARRAEAVDPVGLQ